MAAFPSTIACTVNSGFKDILPETIKGLGGQKLLGNANGKVTAFIKTHAEMEQFTRWYITDINWRVDAFTISLPLFGVTRDWNVRLTKTPDIKPSDKASYIRYVDMELEVLDDIDTYISI
ncbi:hypothetical protein PGH07_07775 [Sulfurovum sp. zt1-1]|uniref:Uncharacterized protein n=1 Tax=Sulfurovum zhangzhouensis TaxID=3019067 RepID=A0ABT7QZ15_9BACT|nr:hypothetical protein [Sulfurovum zhangzhouensis]MDM5272075.1 hypothetical protein [Sulfurovum zhangzhouensis]